MASAIITGLHCSRKFCLLLLQAIQLFHDILSEPYNRCSIKALLCFGCRLLTSSSKQPNLLLELLNFRHSHSVRILPLLEMEESWGGGAALEDQCMRTLPCHPYYSNCMILNIARRP